MAKKDYDKTLSRLTMILTKLSNDERPTTAQLAQEFNVGVRTIQKDIKDILYNYPITRDKEHRLMFEYGYSLERTSLDKDEMIFLNLALSQFDDVEDIDKVKDRIYKKIINKNFFSPYFIKQNDLEDIDIDSPLISRLETAISEQELVDIEFVEFTKTLELYKIAAFDGFWYLLAKDLSDGKTKTFKLSKIKKIIPLNKYHKTPIKHIDNVLEKTHSAFYDDGNCFEVVVKVEETVALYFKNRNFLQSQKIQKQNSDGSLIVSFEITHDEDIDNIIKAWLPYIEVLEPKRYRDKLHKELEEYLKKVKAN